MSLERDDMFFRQFTDWYIGKTAYRILRGRYPRSWDSIGVWMPPRLQEFTIEKVSITNRSVYINDDIDLYEETIYTDREEAEESYELCKYDYEARLKSAKEEYNLLKIS